jgi:hypothetical protein
MPSLWSRQCLAVLHRGSAAFSWLICFFGSAKGLSEASKRCKRLRTAGESRSGACDRRRRSQTGTSIDHRGLLGGRRRNLRGARPLWVRASGPRGRVQAIPWARDRRLAFRQPAAARQGSLGLWPDCREDGRMALAPALRWSLKSSSRRGPRATIFDTQSSSDCGTIRIRVTWCVKHRTCHSNW